MRFGYWLIVALATAGAAAPVRAAGEFDGFVAALDRLDVVEAQRIYAERLEKQVAAKPVRDPVLDRMAGELTQRAGAARAALAFLDRARIGATPAEAAAIALGTARSHESYGNLDAAAAAYRLAAVLPAGDPVGREGRNGLARILVARAPDEAAALSAAVIAAATEPEERWEAELLASRAAAIAGRKPASAAALAAAWADAPAARLDDRAAIRIAQDMANDAFRAGDRARGVALTWLGRSASRLANDQQRPRCGTAGVRPDDSVLVEVAASRFGIRYTAVRANRAGVAQPFVDALARGDQMLDDGMPILVMLRCSAGTTPLPADLPPNPLMEWFAAASLYPVFPNMKDGLAAAVADLEELVRKREQVAGASSPALIPPVLALMGVYTVQAAQSRNSGYGARAEEAGERAATLAAGAGAPAPVIQSLRERIAMQKEMNAPRASQDTAGMSKRFDAFTGSTEADTVTIARAALALLAMDAAIVPVETRLPIVQHALDTLKQRGARPDGAEMRVVTRALIDAMRKVDATDRIPALAKAAGLAASDCEAQAHPPRLDTASQQIITPDTYPKDVLVAALEGITQVELDIDTAGRTSAPRIVVASPPELFDDVTLASARAFRFEPQSGTGVIAACRGISQRVRWQIPEDYDPRLTGGLGQPGN